MAPAVVTKCGLCSSVRTGGGQTTAQAPKGTASGSVWVECPHTIRSGIVWLLQATAGLSRVTETVWPAKPQVVTVWSLSENVCWPLAYVDESLRGRGSIVGVEPQWPKFKAWLRELQF